MLEFNDMTLIESRGSFLQTKEIMGNGPWMLRSDMVVITEFISSSFLIHAWDTGRFEIIKTDRPARIDNTPDDDIKEIKTWCEKNQWDGPYVHKNIVSDPHGFEFWMRFFRAGIIYSEFLQEYEAEQIARMS